MHQPYYRNPVGGEYRMPWTFLHAAKDYYDMLRLAVEAGARVTFNLVPSLIDQLEDYSDPAVPDTFLDPLRAHPSELTADTRADLVPRLFLAHLENQIRRFARYFELYEKGRYYGARTPQSLSDQDLLDLEVLYLLAWTGEVVQAEEPLVKALAGKGRAFTQREKEALLGVLHRVAGRTAEAYREAQERAQIEVSTTPYYHPILPLLTDPASAREALPRITLPVIQRGFGADAARHVDDAIERYRRVFGLAPAGFWPSEGSVSGQTLSLLADRGIRWAASDEDILAASLGVKLEGSARAELYRAHKFRSGLGKEIAVFFRDKTLSDLIGFSYASWNPQDASADFAARVAAIAREHPGGTVSVILDGENAWEFYPHNGAPFLRALYRALANQPEVRFATFSESVGGAKPLSRVHSGSWIYGSFSTWVGHPEKNRAWELLERTRCRLTDEEERIAPEQRELAWREIRIAEGSDWFWWLGDDHYSPIAGEFDQLFRLHLMNVYRLLGLEPPAEILTPIKGGGRRGLLRKPSGPVSPRIDGEVSSFFEWLAAGGFDLGYDAGAMHRADRRLQRLRFGIGGDRLHLCVEAGGGLTDLRGQGLSIEVEATASRRLRLRVPVDGGNPQLLEGTASPAEISAAWGRVGEFSLPLPALGLGLTREVYVVLRIVRDGEVLERAPLYNPARIELPEDHDLECWSA